MLAAIESDRFAPLVALATADPTVARGATVVSVSEQISQRELRNDSGRIMRALDDGQSFVINRNGVPVGELVPLRRHRFVSANAAVAMFKDAPRVEWARLRADLDDATDHDLPDRV
jgi:antitoxin (DNA-binding transcriptional repressor) of toxin-antitoxin stability system